MQTAPTIQQVRDWFNNVAPDTKTIPYPTGVKALPPLHTFDGYQEWALTTAGKQTIQSTGYLTMKLGGEAGEIADKLAKLDRDHFGIQRWEEVPENLKRPIVMEMGDLLWYAAVIAHRLTVPFSYVTKLDSMTGFQNWVMTIAPEGWLDRISPVTLALVEAAGRFCGRIESYDRGEDLYRWDQIRVGSGRVEMLVQDLATVVGRLATISRLLNIDFATVGIANYLKLEDRKARGTLKGDGDNR